MGTAVLEAPQVLKSPTLASALTQEEQEETVPRKKWTRDEYRRMISEGILKDGPYELVLGEIWKKMGHGRRHIAACTRLTVALGRIFDPYSLQSQASLPVAANGDPEPDIAVLAGIMDDYLGREPVSEEIMLVVEISDSTLHADLTAKARQYGSGGISDYWVVDIPNRLLHVFREPTVNGYASETILTTDDEVRPHAAPDSPVSVSDLLP